MVGKVPVVTVLVAWILVAPAAGQDWRYSLTRFSRSGFSLQRFFARARRGGPARKP